MDKGFTLFASNIRFFYGRLGHISTLTYLSVFYHRSLAYHANSFCFCAADMLIRTLSFLQQDFNSALLRSLLVFPNRECPFCNGPPDFSHCLDLLQKPCLIPFRVLAFFGIDSKFFMLSRWQLTFKFCLLSFLIVVDFLIQIN